MTIASGTTFFGASRSTTYLSCTITNNGTIALAPGASGAAFIVTSSVTLTGTGTTQLRAIRVEGGGDLVIDQAVSLNTVDLAGGVLADESGVTLGSDTGAGVATGYGTIAAALNGAGGTTSVITASGGVLDLQGAVDPVALTVAAGLTLKLDANAVATSASLDISTSTLEIGPGVTLATTDSDTLGAGTLRLDGQGALLDATAPGTSITLGYETISTQGSITMIPGLITGTGTGTVAGTLSGFGLIDSGITVTGGVVEASGGTLVVEAGFVDGSLDVGSAPTSELVLDGRVNPGIVVSFTTNAASGTGSGTVEIGSDIDVANGGFAGTIDHLANGATIEIRTSGAAITSALYDPAISAIRLENGTGTTIGTIDTTQPESGLEVGDLGGNDYALTTNTLIPCFLRGPGIRTPHGDMPVELLEPGDTVITATGERKRLGWVGMGRTLATPLNRERCAPIVVRRHAIAIGVPYQDLFITRGHSLFIDGYLIPAEELVNHRSIAYVPDDRVVEYYHLELDNHDVLLAERTPAESYREDENCALFHNARTRDDRRVPLPYAPILNHGPVLQKIWRYLSDRAGGPRLRLTEDPDLHLRVDGIRIDGERIEPKIWRFHVRSTLTTLSIASRSVVPAAVGWVRTNASEAWLSVRSVSKARSGWSK